MIRFNVFSVVAVRRRWLCVVVALLLGTVGLPAAAPLEPSMPRAEDFTLLWWANGPQRFHGMQTPSSGRWTDNSNQLVAAEVRRLKVSERTGSLSSPFPLLSIRWRGEGGRRPGEEWFGGPMRDGFLGEFSPRTAAAAGKVSLLTSAATGNQTEAVLCLQSGTLGVVLDTQTVRLLHAGRFSKPQEIEGALRPGNASLFKLPPVALELRVRVGDREFRCVGRGALPKDDFYFPVRFVEYGRFFQRVAIEDLEFADAAGARLEAKGWFELAMWPDRVVLAFDLARTNAPAQAELELVVAGRRARQSLSTGRPVVLELFRSENPQRPVIESDASRLVGRSAAVSQTSRSAIESAAADASRTAALQASNTLRLSQSKETGSAVLDLPRRQWQNAKGTYYPEEELDRLDRWRFTVRNDSDREATLPIMFVNEHPPAITGFTPMLCEADGTPTGIPVQISKNWHTRPDKGVLRHQGPWFHGCTFVRMPPRSRREFCLQMAYARYGGVPAASHAQLSLIGWGHNQFWDESAIGSFGESICYEPGRVQRRCSIDDIRPLMTLAGDDAKPYGWAGNGGGGDFLVWFDEAGRYRGFRGTRCDYRAYGPCLTDVRYAEETIGGEIESRVSVSIARSDDYLRAFHHLRYEVRQPVKWQRLAFYQLGADYYNDTPARRVAIGNAGGMSEEWEPIRGNDVYDRRGVALAGEQPWVSIHGVERAAVGKGGAFASRGLIVRSWKAVLGGKPCPQPHVSFFANEWGRRNARTAIELSPPPGLTALRPGDYVEADVELVMFPADARAYYGPNEPFRKVLAADADTWRLVHREAAGNELRVRASKGKVERNHPLLVAVDRKGRAACKVSGGMGYLPVTFSGLSDYRGFELLVDGRPLDQSIHGQDFWQTDFDPARRKWRITYNIFRDGQGTTRLELRQGPF